MFTVQWYHLVLIGWSLILINQWTLHKRLKGIESLLILHIEKRVIFDDTTKTITLMED